MLGSREQTQVWGLKCVPFLLKYLIFQFPSKPNKQKVSKVETCPRNFHNAFYNENTHIHTHFLAN